MLKDKIALVTGASRGIGKEIALVLASQGADIILVDINESLLQSAAKEVESRGVKTLIIKADVSNSAEVEKMADQAYQHFGKIDILVNNAGITRDNLILRMKDEEWDQVLSVNLKGVFNCTKAVSRYMIKQRQGKIINIASVIGIAGNAGQSNYAASKAGVIAFTKSAAKEFSSRNINVNAIAPGFIQTDMTDGLKEDVKKQMLERIPLGRLGTSQDIANVVSFLVSPSADYITGQTVVVDGGMVM
ncbi:MAG: 3-oxoacyl-[acyl-carrier-protein] reductase [Planctomycetota bacterium]